METERTAPDMPRQTTNKSRHIEYSLSLRQRLGDREIGIIQKKLPKGKTE